MKESTNMLVICAVIAAVLMCITSAGCIKLVQKNIGQEETSGDLQGTEFPEVPSSAGVPVASSLIAFPVQDLSDSSVCSADPVFPADYFRPVRNLTGRNGEQATVSLQDSWSSRVPLYSLHYSPLYNATAIQVNVTQGPLVIIFKAIPKQNEPRISFAEITVRKLPSEEIVAEEHIDHFLENDVETESNQGTPETGDTNFRQLVLFREGMYHVNLYGNQVDIDVTILTGDSPSVTGSTGVVLAPMPPPEENEVWA